VTLVFDPEAHAYFVDGVRIPSVTQIIQRQFLIERTEEVIILPFSPKEYMLKIGREDWDLACNFGTAVHTATEYDDHGILNEASLDTPLVPYLEAWRKFKSDTRCEILSIEEQGFSEKYKFGFTLDRIVRIRKLPNPRTCVAVLDIKSGDHAHLSARIQTAGYQAAYNEVRKAGRAVQRLSVNLFKDGNYRVHWWDDPTDWPAFLGCLTLYNWFQANHK